MVMLQGCAAGDWSHVGASEGVVCEAYCTSKRSRSSGMGSRSWSWRIERAGATCVPSQDGNRRVSSGSLLLCDMELRTEILINAPAEAAWAVVGEGFGRIGEWAVPITASSLDGDVVMGTTRTCQIAGFGPFSAGEVKERLVDFDRAAMCLTYQSTAGLPGFVRSAVNRWSVQPATDSTCVVRTHATLEIRGPMRLLGVPLARKLESEAALVLDQLRHQVEQGRPHPRKRSAA